MFKRALNSFNKIVAKGILSADRIRRKAVSMVNNDDESFDRDNITNIIQRGVDTFNRIGQAISNIRQPANNHPIREEINPDIYTPTAEERMAAADIVLSPIQPEHVADKDEDPKRAKFFKHAWLGNPDATAKLDVLNELYKSRHKDGVDRGLFIDSINLTTNEYNDRFPEENKELAAEYSPLELSYSRLGGHVINYSSFLINPDKDLYRNNLHSDFYQMYNAVSDDMVTKIEHAIGEYKKFKRSYKMTFNMGFTCIAALHKVPVKTEHHAATLKVYELSPFYLATKRVEIDPYMIKQSREFDIITSKGIRESIGSTITIRASYLKQLIYDMFEFLRDRIDKMELNTSGWSIQSISQIDLQIQNVIYTGGGSYCELPLPLRTDKVARGFFNNKASGENDKCFKYNLFEMLDYIYSGAPDKIKEKKVAYEKFEVDNNVTYPFPLSVELFQLVDIAIKSPLFVYQYVKSDKTNAGFNIENVYASSNKDFAKDGGDDKYCSLLFYESDDSNTDKLCHYVGIKSEGFRSLVRLRLTVNDKQAHKFCQWCTGSIMIAKNKGGMNEYYNHIKDCTGIKEHKYARTKHNDVACLETGNKYKLPLKGEVLQFKNHNRIVSPPAIVVADFESLAVSVTAEERDIKLKKAIEMNEQRKHKKTIEEVTQIVDAEIDAQSTHKLSRHEACAFTFSIIDPSGKIIAREFYRGPNAGRVFIEKLCKYEAIMKKYIISCYSHNPSCLDCCECHEDLQCDCSECCIGIKSWNQQCKKETYTTLNVDYFRTAKKKEKCSKKEKDIINKDVGYIHHECRKKRNDHIASSTKCWMCEEATTQPLFADYCTISGMFRGVAHESCILKNEYKSTYMITNNKTGERSSLKGSGVPVYFHNLTGYDAHIIIKAICELNNARSIKCLARNLEKVFSIDIENTCFRIVDSYQLMADSLSNLVDVLSKDIDKNKCIGEEIKKVFPITHQLFCSIRNGDIKATIMNTQSKKTTITSTTSTIKPNNYSGVEDFMNINAKTIEYKYDSDITHKLIIDKKTKYFSLPSNKEEEYVKYLESCVNESRNVNIYEYPQYKKTMLVLTLNIFNVNENKDTIKYIAELYSKDIYNTIQAKLNNVKTSVNYHVFTSDNQVKIYYPGIAMNYIDQTEVIDAVDNMLTKNNMHTYGNLQIEVDTSAIITTIQVPSFGDCSFKYCFSMGCESIENMRKYKQIQSDQKIKHISLLSDCYGSEQIDSGKATLDINHISRTVNRPKPHLGVKHLQMMIRKNIIPYEFITSHESFQTNIDDLTIENFKSCLDNYRDCDPEEFAFFKEFAKEFHIKTLGEYHDIYLLIDVALLADVLQENRKILRKDFHLDPAHYLTLPSYSLDAMLKCTKVQIELLSTLDGYNFFDTDPKIRKKHAGDPKYNGAIRGGITQVVMRHAKANNVYMGDKFKDEVKDFVQQFITYLDANSLYPTAMKMLLPDGNFKVEDATYVKFVNDFFIDLSDAIEKNIQKNGFTYREPVDKIGMEINNRFVLDVTNSKKRDVYLKPCFLEVDLEYPEYLHEYLNDLPPAPVPAPVKKESLSPFQNILYMFGDHEYNESIDKLLCTLEKKEHYKIHYKTLETYMNLGVKVTKVHKVMTFTESKWMAPYIDKCVALRAASKNKFAVKLYKDMINSVFGKMMERVRDRVNIEFLKDTTDAEVDTIIRKINKSKDYNLRAFTDNMMMIEFEPDYVKLDKPVFVGAAILDLSKAHMYAFFYMKFKRIMGDKLGTPLAKQIVKLMYTDTDSLIMLIKSPDFLEKMIQCKSTLFDNSDVASSDRNDPMLNEVLDKLYDKGNKKIPGFFKDEMGFCIITEVYALSPKMYSIQTLDDSIDKKMKAKGIKSSVTKYEINHNMYADAFHSSTAYYSLIKAGFSKDNIDKYIHGVYDIDETTLDDNTKVSIKYLQQPRKGWELLLNNFTPEEIVDITSDKPKSEEFIELQKNTDFDILEAIDLGKFQRCHTQHQFRSYVHEIYTIKVEKTSINARDSKRYICDDGNNTFPYGSKLIPKDLRTKEEKATEEIELYKLVGKKPKRQAQQQQ